MNHTRINPSDARDVLDVLGNHNHDGDCECGDFKCNLITAIICAGPEDRARLALGFPSLVAAIESQTSNPASIEYLQGIARSYERAVRAAPMNTLRQLIAHHTADRTSKSYVAIGRRGSTPGHMVPG